MSDPIKLEFYLKAEKTTMWFRVKDLYNEDEKEPQEGVSTVNAGDKFGDLAKFSVYSSQSHGYVMVYKAKTKDGTFIPELEHWHPVDEHIEPIPDTGL